MLSSGGGVILNRCSMNGVIGCQLDAAENVLKACVSALTRTWAHGLALGGLLMLGACARTEQRALREPIAMGPWTFSVEGATASTEVRGGGRWRKVRVHLRVHAAAERDEPPFDAFLNGGGRGNYIVFPRFDLRDAQGTRFETLLHPSSLSDVWTADFVLVPADAPAMADSVELARPYQDKDAEDFQLVISNPDRRRGQPGRVSIQLR